ncbi:SCO family protein [Rhodomicrobium vannielii]|uniref:SCO family protein n=1 Tax=Rhodomicrobium vannielii TaxID=1069 RepID=UPI001AED03BF|nr:SCO family protein [Rhodomicrobium vannielii]
MTSRKRATLSHAKLRWRGLVHRLGRALPILAILALMAASQTAAAAPQNSRFSPKYFTDVMVTTHEGKTVPFYEGLLKGKKVVINFIYTNCNDICPLQTARMAQLRQRLGDLVGRDFFIYSITMDPEHDTPEVLNAYADAFGAGGGWLFITGNPGDIEKIRWRLGERSRELFEHRNDLVLGNDETGEWSRSSVFEEYDVAVEEIRQLDPVYFQTKRTALPANQAPTDKGLRLDRQAGEALYMRGCAICHSIGDGNAIGPDLKDLTKRRERAWLSRFLLHPVEMREQKDPITMELLAQYNNIKMPNLSLTPDDVTDLLQYIEVRSQAHDRKEIDGKAGPGAHDGPG